MREIKFDYIIKADSGELIHCPYRLSQLEGLLELAGLRVVARRQYIGLKDKNGVEIYEGDIVRFQVENENMWSGATRGQVDYEESEACFVIVNKGKSYVTIGHGYDAYPSSLEVIGNIYDNPELLQQAA